MISLYWNIRGHCLKAISNCS